MSASPLVQHSLRTASMQRLPGTMIRCRACRSIHALAAATAGPGALPQHYQLASSAHRLSASLSTHTLRSSSLHSSSTAAADTPQQKRADYAKKITEQRSAQITKLDGHRENEDIAKQTKNQPPATNPTIPAMTAATTEASSKQHGQNLPKQQKAVNAVAQQTIQQGIENKQKRQREQQQTSDVNISNTSDEQEINLPGQMSAKMRARMATKLHLRKYEEPGMNSRLQAAPSLYSTKHNPTTHTEAEIGTFYNVKDDIHQSLPRSIRKHLDETFRLSGHFLMVREVGYKLTQQLKQRLSTPLQGDAPQLLTLEGSIGTGKSSVLYYACHFAREAGAILLATDAMEFMTEKRGSIRASTVHEGVYDQPPYTSEWMQELLKNEEPRLAMIALDRKYEYNWFGNPVDGEPRTVAIVENPQSLADMVKLGANDSTQSAAILWDLTAVLRSQTQVPVFVAVDSYNLWDSHAQFRHPVTLRKLKPRKLALVAALDAFVEQPPANGTVLLSTTGTYNIKQAQKYLEPLTQWHDEVLHLNHAETEYMLAHYRVSKYMFSELTDEFQTQLKVLSGNVPKTLFRVAGAM